MMITRQTIARQIRNERAVNAQMSARYKESNEDIRRKVYGNVRAIHDPHTIAHTLVPTMPGQYGDSTGDAFPSYAWPGGYTIEYVTNSGDVLCAECARREVMENHGKVYADTYDEGPTIQCDDCGKDLESSCGDPDEDQD